MRRRLEDKLDDGMHDEDWEDENGELLSPGVALWLFWIIYKE